LLEAEPTSTVARKLGVAERSLRQRCKQRNILTKPTGYWSAIIADPVGRKRKRRVLLNKNKQARRDWLLQLRNGPCGRCNQKFPAVCMDWHHRDKSTKSFTISKQVTRSAAKILAEIAKCDLLCANCHRIVEAEEKPNGTYARFVSRDVNSHTMM
jgi:hypothetical protein